MLAVLRDLARWLIGLPNPQPEPEPPEGVIIVWPDGHTEEIPVIYLGHRDGIHRWEGVIAPRAEYLDQWASGDMAPHIRIGRMPAHTSIEMCCDITDHIIG